MNHSLSSPAILSLLGKTALGAVLSLVVLAYPKPTSALAPPEASPTKRSEAVPQTPRPRSPSNSSQPAPPRTTNTQPNSTPANPDTASPSDLPTLLQRVTEARRRLAQRETNAATQGEQKAALALFDRLIDVAQREQQAPRGGGGGANSSSKPKDAADEKPEAEPPPAEAESPEADSSTANPNGMTERRGPGGEWGKLRDKQREPVLNTLQERFPPRYRQLVDRYFQSFAHERR